jgi:hypothetical protein
VNPAWFGRTTRLTAASIVAIGHLMFAIATIETQPEGVWQATMLIVDFPFSLLWLLWLQDAMDPFIFFGMVGSTWWFQLTYCFVWALSAVMPKEGSDEQPVR